MRYVHIERTSSKAVVLISDTNNFVPYSLIVTTVFAKAPVKDKSQLEITICYETSGLTKVAPVEYFRNALN